LEVIEWHRLWLESVYPWAGQVRRFNLSKGNFAFASAHLLPDLLKAFQREQLNRRTPFDPQSIDELVEALADVMASQAGIGPLDYSAWDLQREQYFGAIRAGAVWSSCSGRCCRVGIDGRGLPSHKLAFNQGDGLARFDCCGAGHCTNDPRPKRDAASLLTEPLETWIGAGHGLQRVQSILTPARQARPRRPPTSAWGSSSPS
jgi:cell filamentation protein